MNTGGVCEALWDKNEMSRIKSKYNVKEKVDLLKQPVQQNAVQVKLYFRVGLEILRDTKTG